MEGMLQFVGIVVIVFGILQIILFFKIWGMTNDVSKIKNLLQTKLSTSQATKDSLYINQSKIENTTLSSDINIGDCVIRLTDRKKMTVDSIENNRYFCKVSSVEGYKYFERNEIELHNK